mmetsp:Transcript_23773/g.34067  ORF Transcript_23773/g.34067 Transcript_23773/m.34067 type:complete len:120 (-) Transcript_23773:21-380(-)
MLVSIHSSMGCSGVFLKCGHGNKAHQHHPKLLECEMLFLSRLVKAAELETLKELGNWYANCGIGRSYMFRKTVLFLARSQIRWLYDEDASLHKHSIDETQLLEICLNFLRIQKISTIAY